MFRIPVPFTSVSFLFTPRFGELPTPLQALLLLLCAVVPLALVVWLYRYELRLVRPLVALGLLGLRLLVLALLLLVIGFQPVAARTATEALPGRVLIAVDRSDSMATADPQRATPEKLRLALGLGLARDLCTDPQLTAWIQQYETRGRVVWHAGGGAFGADEARLHEQVCQRIDTLSRSRIAHQVLTRDGADLYRAVAARHGVELLTFTQETADVAADQLDRLAEAPAGSGTAGAYTDLRLPLVRALERSGTDQSRILGVVLLTDGQHNWGPSPVAKAIELGRQNLPIYPVPIGARQPPTDIAIASVQAPPAVFKGAEVPVEARVQVNGLSARELVVTLERPGQPPLTEKLPHDGTNHVYAVSFTPKLEQVGTQILTVTVRPEKEEIRSDNNRRSLAVNVADDKAKVLLIDCEARWEYHYLASVLARDKTMALRSVVFVQPRLGKLTDAELRKLGVPEQKLPAEADALLPYDCIILGDTSTDQLPLSERQRLEKYVADRGGTLVVLAGKRSMPLAFTGDDDPLAKLLPVQQPHVFKPPDGFPVTLTAEGRLSAFLQLEATADQSAQRWASLPRHFWGVVGRAKPGAVPLAVALEDAPAGGRPADPAAARSASEREKDNALIVRQNYGFGRVLFVGLDSTWRWRYKTGDTYHHKFWGQVIRWAASDKPLVAGNDAIRFGTREPFYRQGQEVELVARLGDTTKRLAPDALAGVRILRLPGAGKEENAGLVPLKQRENQPRELEARVRDLAPGTYAIELVIPDLADKLVGSPGPDGKPAKLRAGFTVTPPDSSETVDLATNWPLLEELAAKSGGKVFPPENAAELVNLLTEKMVTRSFHVEHKAWQSWLTLVLFLTLLTLEWVGRKWAGLP